MKPKVLYAFCGTGQGHMTKALSLKPEMEKRYTVEYLVSSLNNPLLFDVDYQLSGATFKFKNGALDLKSTFRDVNVKKMFSEITSTKLSEYDFVINDHEPITAYASYYSGYENLCTLSHQASFIHSSTPRPPFRFETLPERLLAEYVLSSYAKNTSEKSFGLHFRKYHENIFYPLLRKEIIDMTPSTDGSCLVYLPKESPTHLLSIFSKIKKQNFIVYDPKQKTDETCYDNVIFRKTDNKSFLETLRTCSTGIINSGFELPSEMMYLGKKILTTPQTGQYEQECNQAALKQLGVYTVDRLTQGSIENFLTTSQEPILQPVSTPVGILNRLETAMGR